MAAASGVRATSSDSQYLSIESQCTPLRRGNLPGPHPFPDFRRISSLLCSGSGWGRSPLDKVHIPPASAPVVRLWTIDPQGGAIAADNNPSHKKSGSRPLTAFCCVKRRSFGRIVPTVQVDYRPRKPGRAVPAPIHRGKEHGRFGPRARTRPGAAPHRRPAHAGLDFLTTYSRIRQFPAGRCIIVHRC
jgi:hypothetical protein